MIKVDTVCLETQAQQMKIIAEQLNGISSRVASINRALRWNTGVGPQIRSSLSSSSKSVSSLDDKANRLCSALSASAKKYEAAEQNAKKGEYTPGPLDVIRDFIDDIIPDGIRIPTPVAVLDLEAIQDILQVIGIGGAAAGAAGWVAGSGSSSSSSNGWNTSYTASWLGYEVADDHPGVTAWIGKASGRKENENGYVAVNAYLGKVDAGVKADGGFMKKKVKETYKDGKWETSESMELLYAEVEAGVSVNAGSVDGSMGVGDDMLGAGVNANINVGNAAAKGSGELSIGENGVNANFSGELMVSAVEAKTSGTINILGIEIKGTVGGYAGAAGVKGKVGFDDGKFVCEGGVAAGLGFSGGIEIGFNETGWENAKEAVKEGAENLVVGIEKGVDVVADGAEKVIDIITFWD